MRRSKQLAYLFEDEGAATVTARGGKGFGLCELARLSVPVPAGFTVTTSVARAFAQHGCAPMRLSKQLQRQIENLEKVTGQGFGSIDNALLVSVRSGASVSMPGMMDTVLNLGLNPEIVHGLAKRHNARFAYDCYRRFLSMFGEVVLGVDRFYFDSALKRAKKEKRVEQDSKLSAHALRSLCKHYRNIIEKKSGATVPDDPWTQLELAITAVLFSWNNPRAVAYRQMNGISNGLGTAVNVQSMVYGNLDDSSGTGVVFSRNVATGENRLYGEFLINAQGEDVVAGSRTPLPIEGMSAWNGAAFSQLSEFARKLEAHRNDVVDIEFTVESGQLYILQVRNAKRTPEAAATIATHFVWEKRWTKKEALSRVSADQLKALGEASFSEPVLSDAAAAGKVVACGLAASPGAAVGRVVVTSAEAVAAARLGEKVILVRPETSPDDLSGMLAAAAIVTSTGGSTSHAAVVARGLSKPAVVGCGDLMVEGGQVISVDGRTGLVLQGALERTGCIDKKEINLLQKWAGAANIAELPTLHFEMIEERVSAYQLLNDFYIIDEVAKASIGTKLERQSLALKTSIHKEVADRLAMYLVMALIGETYYCFSDGRYAMLLTECLVELKTLEREYDAAHGPLDKLKEMPQSMHVRFLDLIATVFEARAWGDVGYAGIGGKKWAEIARAAQGYLNGRMNATIFADHAFDLEHNGGCIIGKHQMISTDFRRNFKAGLETKKHTSGVSRLYANLTHRWPEVSDEIKTLFHNGVKLGLWESPSKIQVRID